MQAEQGRLKIEIPMQINIFRRPEGKGAGRSASF